MFVRGYGLVDSKRAMATPGKPLNLTAAIAPNEHAAAQYYPAGQWLSLLRIPEAGEFPGTGPQGNGINPNVKSQAEWVRMIKSGGCTACHQLGTKGTREIPKELGTFPSLQHAWERRLASGQAGAQMLNGINNLGKERALLLFADWTDRINRGEVPPAPPRPQGVERNVVITLWDWADPKAYLHDVVSTDRRKPTLNANGLLYGALELSADYMPVLDPKTQHHQPDSAERARSRTRRRPRRRWPRPRRTSAKKRSGPARTTCTTRCSTRGAACGSPRRCGRRRIPAFCKEGSTHPSAKLFPIQRRGRHLQVYDPATKKLTHIARASARIT